MARPSRATWRKNSASASRLANASDSFASWASVSVNRVRWWRKPTRKNKPRIKKLRVLAQNPDVDLWAIDEVHFQQHGSRSRLWVPPEVADPILLHAPTRKSVCYFGAVRLRDGKFIFSRETGRFDGMTTWNFLTKLRQRSRRSGRRVVVIIDNAKYHHAKL